MHYTLILGTATAAAAIAYAFKPKKPKTELEEKSVEIPIPPHYLPFQIDMIVPFIVRILLGGDELDGIHEMVKKYGTTMNFRSAGQDFIIVIEPSSIQHVLAKHQPNYEKGPEFNEIFHEFLGSGIFNADGETWKTQRQIARPHFQTSEFKDVALINKHADQLIKVMTEQIDSNPNSSLEMQDLFTRFTLDEASEFLFGETVNSLRDKDSEFITAFNYAQMITAWRFRVPFWQYFVPKRRLLREVGVLDKFVLKIINNAIARKEAKEKSGEVPSDDEKGIHHDNLLDHFLHYQTENGFSKTYLRDMLLNFMIAGRDTTASLLTWTVWYLVEHPEVAEKVYNEILSVLGSTSIPTYDDIKKLKYQKQVINEVLRLRPPVPFNMRQSVEEDVLPNGYYIPPHTIVSYSAYVTHRMTEYWGEDADKFDPDRWGPERVGSIKPFMFVPFHAGPRICLGQNLAYTTAQIALTRLLQNFVFKPVTGFEPQKFGDIVLFSRNGVEVMVEKRNPVQL